MRLTAENAADLYLAAWDAADDDEETRSCVAKGFTTDAEVIGVNDVIRGADAIAQWINERKRNFTVNTRTSVVDEHHGWLRFEWEYVTAAGEAGDGIDVGHLAEDGRLDLLIAFAPLSLPPAD